MKKFVLVDSKGEIVSNGSCEDCDFEAHAIEGCMLLESEGHPSTHYFLAGEKISYTQEQMLAKMNKPLVPAEWSNKSFTYEVSAEQIKEVKAVGARQQRDALIAASDVMVLRAYEEGRPPSAQVKQYRQALRDVTKQSGFPSNIKWPSVPKED